MAKVCQQDLWVPTGPGLGGKAWGDREGKPTQSGKPWELLHHFRET